MYTPHAWEPEVEAVEVVKQTAQTVTVLESEWNGKRRERKRMNNGDYFDTWEQAKAAMVEQARQNVERSKNELQRRRTRLGQLEAMQPPKATP